MMATTIFAPVFVEMLFGWIQQQEHVSEDDLLDGRPVTSSHEETHNDEGTGYM